MDHWEPSIGKNTGAYEKAWTGAARSKLVPMTMADQEYAPKPSKTWESRVEKCAQQILNGKGMND
jgi:uncharacterized protein YdeI (YjbR/CyaY-like superfamily)